VSATADGAHDRAKLDDRLPEVVEFAKGLKNEFETVSLMGYCWGECLCERYR
jgi:dienelactone hydrolase